MATFIALISETDKGVTQFQNTVSRAKTFVDAAAKHGAQIKGQYWTMGGYDGVLIFEAPDDETASAIMCRLCMDGAVRTQTLRAFDAAQMEGILKKAAG